MGELAAPALPASALEPPRPHVTGAEAGTEWHEVSQVRASHAVDASESAVYVEERPHEVDDEVSAEDRERLHYSTTANGAMRAEACRQRGNVAFARGDLVVASRCYRQALEAQPDDASARSNLAACALSESPPRPEEALALLQPRSPRCAPSVAVVFSCAAS